jgi:hypothetical protein
MGENLMGKLPKLLQGEGHLKDIQWVWDDCPRDLVPFKDRQETLKLLLEASMLFRGTWARHRSYSAG